MSQFSLEELPELSGILETICHAVYHDIFIKYSLVGDLSILSGSCHENIEWIEIIDWLRVSSFGAWRDIASDT